MPLNLEIQGHEGQRFKFWLHRPLPLQQLVVVVYVECRTEEHLLLACIVYVKCRTKEHL